MRVLKRLEKKGKGKLREGVCDARGVSLSERLWLLLVKIFFPRSCVRSFR